MTDQAHVRFALRPYQEQAIRRTLAASQRGVMRQLGVAATGLGKTIVFCALAERMGCRTLVLAHRDELIEQAAAKVGEVWPGATVGVVKAERDEYRAQVVVASVQTLARGKRLDRLTSDGGLLMPLERFGLVVVDEAHHTAAPTYRATLDALGAGQPGGPLVLGVTATPDRGDGKGLDDLFDEVTWSYDLLWGIRSGWLSDVRGLRVEVANLDMGDVAVRRGDYDQGQAGAALMTAGAPTVIARAYLQHAPGRRALVFCPTVAMAEATAGEFHEHGVRAGWVAGSTPTDERRALLRDFATGALDVMVNCMVLTEGYDEPRADCIIVARPTRSRALYAQMVGRGTRKHPDKTDCLVLDVVGATEEHSLVTIPTLFNIEAGYAKRLGNGEATVSDVAAEQEAQLVRVGRLRAEEVELFAAIRAEGIAWVAVHTDGQPRQYQRSLGTDDQGNRLPVVVMGERDGAWFASLRNDDGTKRALISGVSMDLAQGVAEDYVRRFGSKHLVQADAAWRSRKPTPKQLAAAKKWRMRVDPAWTAGQLSEAMDAHIARVKARSR